MPGQRYEEPPAIRIYVSLSRYNGKPAIVLRRIITDPEVVREFTLAMIKHETLKLPALFTVSNKLAFIANAKRLGVVSR